MNKLLPILLVVVMCGCATITGGGKQSLTITSYYKNTNNELIEMNGAKCSLENSNTQLNVETPNKGLSIPRNSGPLYISCEKIVESRLLKDKEYCSGKVKIFPNRLDPLTGGNIAGGFLAPIGAAVDAATSAALLYPSDIKITLNIKDSKSKNCNKQLAYNKPLDLKDQFSNMNPLGGSNVDFAGSKTQLTELFFKSDNYYKESLAILADAYEQNVLAEQIRANIKYANDSKNSEADRMKNSIKVTTEASMEMKKIILDEGDTISAEGKRLYAKSLVPAGKGVLTTIKLVPVAKNMATNITANPTSALTELGGLVKVIPNLPGYITTMASTMKVILSGAKANDIEGADDLEASLGDL